MNFKKIIISFITLLYLEIVYHLFVFKTFSIKSAFYILIFTILGSIFLDIITSLFNKWFNKWLFIISCGFLCIIFLAQLINYEFYGNVFSIYSMFHGGQVFDWFDAIFSVIAKNLVATILLILPIILLIIFHKKITTENVKYKYVGIKIAAFIIIYIGCILSLNFDATDIYSAKKLYFEHHAPNYMAQTFGILTTMRLDLQRTFNGFEESSLTIEDTSNNTDTTDSTEYNVTEIDFNSLIANDTDETIKNIDEYVSSLTPTEKNKYTGMFEGKNLIAIVAESFSPIAVDKDLTPTLYKLVNTGFKFTNFYTPVYYVSTSDGEYVTLTSLLPKESVWSFSESSDNYLPYTYGHIFGNMGYTTYAFHDGVYTYYKRNKSHPNMGYSFLACGNGLEDLMNCNKWPQSDVEMINATYNYYGNSDHFATYYMTISGHLEYNFYGNNMAYKNKSYVEDLPYSTAVKAYIAGQIELDKALETLLDKLEESGKLDDTVIVLSADHYPYGLTTSEMSEVMDIKDEKFDTQKNYLVIWNSEMTKSIEIDKYAESLDILPTILNLFGINYDSRLLMGSDILSDSDGLVILNDRSWITKYGKYNAATSTFTAFTDDDLPDNYIEKINTIVYNKYTISKNILDTDYYSHVFNGE